METSTRPADSSMRSRPGVSRDAPMTPMLRRGVSLLLALAVLAVCWAAVTAVAVWVLA
jgi:hypothetical protein